MQRTIILIFIFLLFCLAVPKTVFAADVMINEFVANSHTGEDEWVEFYNQNAIDISFYWIDDDTNFSDDIGNASKKQLTTVNTSNQTFPFYNLTVSLFNNTCDEATGCDYVVLFSQEGLIIDQFQYSSEQIGQKGKSIGRSPDGSGAWTILEVITKGNSNSPPQSTPTPTPIPTSAPTNTPTPTKTPTPKPTSTPKVPTPTPSPTPVKLTSTLKPSATTSPTGSKNPATIFPTSVLGESTESAKNSISITDKPKVKISTSEKETKVLAASTNNLSKILIGIGIIFLISCGILAFRGYVKNRKENNYSG